METGQNAQKTFLSRTDHQQIARGRSTAYNENARLIGGSAGWMKPERRSCSPLGPVFVANMILLAPSYSIDIHASD